MPAAVVSIEASAADFYPLSTQIDVTLSDAADTELLLVPRSELTATVDVVAASPARGGAVGRGRSPPQVLRTPGALDNVFRTLQTLPGVSPAEEFSSRLAVRGGAPDQNLTIMDSVEIDDPYRLFGLTSAFNCETTSRFELATGGFSGKYGDRLSSLLVIESGAGTRRARLNGSAALSITDANVILERSEFWKIGRTKPTPSDSVSDPQVDPSRVSSALDRRIRFGCDLCTPFANTEIG